MRESFSCPHSLAKRIELLSTGCYPISMGHALRTAYSILDDIIARKGEDGFLVEIEHEVICGRKLLEIAQAEGLLYSVLWNWLKDVPERLERYRSALKGYGDALISETVGIADGSGDAKLMVDTRFKIAGKIDKKVWGEDKDVVSGFGAGGITIVIGEVVSPYAQLPVVSEQSDARVPEPVPVQPMQVSTVEEV